MGIDRREMERLIPALRRYARGLSGSAAEADDLVQDCLLRALGRERQFRGGNLAGWLFAILTNLGRSDQRRRRRRPAEGPIGDYPDAGTDPLSRIAIVAALGALSHEQREVLLLVSVEGFTYEETAEILGVPIGTVMSRLARARDRLAERLEGAPVVPLRRLR